MAAAFARLQSVYGPLSDRAVASAACCALAIQVEDALLALARASPACDWGRSYLQSLKPVRAAAANSSRARAVRARPPATH